MCFYSKSFKEDPKCSQNVLYVLLIPDLVASDVCVMTSSANASQEVDGADTRQSLRTNKKVYASVRHVHGSLVEAIVVQRTHSGHRWFQGWGWSSRAQSCGSGTLVFWRVYSGLLPYVFMVPANKTTASAQC